MGCAHLINRVSEPQIKVHDFKQDKIVGQLKLKIQEITIVENQFNFEETSRNYLNIQISNQIHTTELHHNFGKLDKIKLQRDTFVFIINEQNNYLDRKLKIQFFNKQALRYNFKKAQGNYDINHYIRIPQQGQALVKGSFNAYTKIQNKNIGKFSIKVQFTPYDYQTITLKICSITMRSCITNQRSVYVKVIIGEEVFQTQPVIENRKLIPEWFNEIFTFTIPHNLTQGLVQVYQKNNNGNDVVLGELKVNINSFLQTQNLQTYFQNLWLDDQMSGSIKFCTFKGIPNQDTFPQTNNDIKVVCKRTMITKNQIQNLISDLSNNKLGKCEEQQEPTTNFSSLNILKKSDLSMQNSEQLLKILEKANISKNRLRKSLPPIQSSISLTKIIQTSSIPKQQQSPQPSSSQINEIKQDKQKQITIEYNNKIILSNKIVKINPKYQLSEQSQKSPDIIIRKTDSMVIQGKQEGDFQKQQKEVIKNCDIKKNYSIQKTIVSQSPHQTSIKKDSTSKYKTKKFIAVSLLGGESSSKKPSDQSSQYLYPNYDNSLQSKPLKFLDIPSNNLNRVNLQEDGDDFDLSLKEVSVINNQNQNQLINENNSSEAHQIQPLTLKNNISLPTSKNQKNSQNPQAVSSIPQQIKDYKNNSVLNNSKASRQMYQG